MPASLQVTTLLLLALLGSVAAAQEFRYGLFSEECFREYFSRQNFFDVACFKLTLSKALGYGIIAGSFMLKAPQIYKIISSGSVDGINIYSCYFDVVIFQNGILYNALAGYPLSTYGESIVILSQNVFIVFLMWRYSKPPVNFLRRVAVVALCAGLAVFTCTLLPQEHRALLPSFGIALTMWSRVPQIWSNFHNGHTGQLALATWVLNFVGAALRVFTTMQEVNDVLILTGFALGASLSLIIVLQICWYWNASKGGAKAKRS
jgi:mannose-P-dolichol utilization defect protein 1